MENILTVPKNSPESSKEKLQTEPDVQSLRLSLNELIQSLNVDKENWSGSDSESFPCTPSNSLCSTVAMYDPSAILSDSSNLEGTASRKLEPAMMRELRRERLRKASYNSVDDDADSNITETPSMLTVICFT